MSDQTEATAATETGGIQKVFEALSSAPRRKILAFLAHSSLTAGEIADRFEMSKPSISQHLGVLESAGLVRREKRGQFVHYSIVQESLANTLNSYVQEVCPVSRPLKKESAERRARDEERSE
ncbi:MAG: metalloregulator ArsR/SmtB family transcription factor [Pseudomonadota bacterium]